MSEAKGITAVERETWRGDAHALARQADPSRALIGYVCVAVHKLLDALEAREAEVERLRSELAANDRASVEAVRLAAVSHAEHVERIEARYAVMVQDLERLTREREGLAARLASAAHRFARFFVPPSHGEPFHVKGCMEGVNHKPTSDACWTGCHEMRRVLPEAFGLEAAVPRVEVGAGSVAVDGLPCPPAAGASLTPPPSLPPDQGAALDPEKCADDVYRHGKLLAILPCSKADAECLCVRVAEATGWRVDWHYVGGRVVVKYLDAALAGAQETGGLAWRAVRASEDALTAPAAQGRAMDCGRSRDDACAFPPYSRARDDRKVSCATHDTPAPAAQGPRCACDDPDAESCPLNESGGFGTQHGHPAEPAAPAREWFADFDSWHAKHCPGLDRTNDQPCGGGWAWWTALDPSTLATPWRRFAGKTCREVHAAEAGARGEAPERMLAGTRIPEALYDRVFRAMATTRKGLSFEQAVAALLTEALDREPGPAPERCRCDWSEGERCATCSPAPEQASGERRCGCGKLAIPPGVVSVSCGDGLIHRRGPCYHVDPPLIRPDSYRPDAAPPPAGEPEQASGERCGNVARTGQTCSLSPGHGGLFHEGRDEQGRRCRWLRIAANGTGELEPAPHPAGEGTREQEAAAQAARFGSGGGGRDDKPGAEPPRFTDTREGEGCETSATAESAERGAHSSPTPSGSASASSRRGSSSADPDTALVIRAIEDYGDRASGAPRGIPREQACRALAARLRDGSVQLVDNVRAGSLASLLREKLAAAEAALALETARANTAVRAERAAEERTRAAEQDGNALRRQLVALQNAVGGDGTPDALHRKLAMAVAEARAEEREALTRCVIAAVRAACERYELPPTRCKWIAEEVLESMQDAIRARKGE